MEVKVKGKTIKVKDITLDLRMEILDDAIEASQTTKFSSFVKILRNATDLTDEEIMELSTEQISELNLKIVELCNAGKKSKKS
tara:strand:+ start:729 stop:977 length:249 start_codon:yes stop_codon:yes gene_type:complete